MGNTVRARESGSSGTVCRQGNLAPRPDPVRSKGLGLLTLFLIVLGIVVVTAITALSPTGAAAVADPGSQDDPLVSLSYLEEYVNAYINLQVIELKTGNKIIGHQGTELILRSGRATAIGTSLGGLSDVTGGTDVKTGDAVQPNHLMIVPRDDGRGMEATTDCVILVKGRFTISGEPDL